MKGIVSMQVPEGTDVDKNHVEQYLGRISEER